MQPTVTTKQVIAHIEKPYNLTDAEKSVIFKSQYTVALSAFGQEDTLEFRTDVEDHLFDVDGLILITQNGSGVAFRTYKCFDDILYLSGAAVDQNFQRLGLYNELLERVPTNYRFVGTRTQNPRVLAGLAKRFGDVAPVTIAPDTDLFNAGQKLAQHLNIQNYNPQTMVCVGMYGKRLCLNDTYADSDISQRLRTLIDADRGDAVLALCKL